MFVCSQVFGHSGRGFHFFPRRLTKPKKSDNHARIFDEKTFVPGSLSMDQMDTMAKFLKRQLAVYRKEEDPLRLERTVDEALQKIELLVAESSSFMTDHHQSRKRVVVDADLIHSFVIFWKKLALAQKHNQQVERILTPNELLTKLHALSRKQPELKYELRTMGLLLDVVIGTADNPQSAPEVAESWIQHLHKLSLSEQNSTIPSLHKDMYTYSKIIQAWALSERTDATSRIDALWKEIQAEGVQLNAVTCNILLRFWGRQIDHGGVDQIHAILCHMKDQNLEPSMANLAQAIYGLSRTPNTLKEAEKLFFAIVRNEPRYKKEYQLVEESAIHVLLAHRKALDDAAHGTEKVKAISAAENFFSKAETFLVKPSSSSSRAVGQVSKLVVSMMDIYARAGLHAEVESLLNRIRPNLIVYSILIKSYGRYDMADEAAAVVRRLIREARIVPDIHLFNELINAYVSINYCFFGVHAKRNVVVTNEFILFRTGRIVHG
jgi:pentatricopeptide repeat protein